MGDRSIRTSLSLLGVATALSLSTSALLLYRESRPQRAVDVEPRTVTPRGDLAEDEKTTIALFEQASPSVVFVTSAALRSDPFGFRVTEVPQGTGSGFVWDQAGHVVTNYHVVHEASSLEVTLADQSTWPATVVGLAPDKDIAVVRIEAPKEILRPIPVGTSSDLQVGQKAFAIGNPFRLDHTLTTGVVSALGRTIQSMTGRTIEDVVQTDAAINPGNSGGPLLDSAGRLIGISTAIFSPSGASAGIGFAVPVDTVRRAVPQLIQHGKLVRPQMGISIAHDRIAKRIGITGVLIMGIAPGSPAEKAGLIATTQDARGRVKVGDVIVKVAGQPVKSTDDLLNAMEKVDPGQTVEVTIMRGAEEKTLSVTVQ